MTLISALAGSGKSILAAQWLDRAAAPRSAWLSLDGADGDLDRFLGYLVRVLGPLVPGGLPETEAFVKSPGPHAPEAVAECLTCELAGMPRVVLVLDELETIETGPVHEFLCRLVSTMQSWLHLVLLTRVDPPLPLSLWRTRHWLHELRGGDLRFTAREVAEFFEAAGMRSLGTEAMDILHRKTEGWAAGLRLAQISLARAADPLDRVRALSGTSRLIADYLIEEVLSAKPPKVREFLGVMAHLDCFCADLADHVLRRARPTAPAPTDSAAILSQLYANNVFLTPLETDPGWYHFHTMFRQFLLDRATELAPEITREDVLRGAAEWQEQEGHAEEAIRLLVAVGDLDAAADVVCRQLHPALDSDPSRRALGQWLSIFPPTASDGRLPLVVASLYVHARKWSFDAILKALDALDSPTIGADGLRRRWREALQADIDALRGYALFWLGDLGASFRHTAAALKMERPEGAFRDDFLQAYHLLALTSVGPNSAYEQVLDEELLHAKSHGGNVSACLAGKAFVAFSRGQFREAREVALAVLAMHDESQRAKHLEGAVAYLLGAIAYELNDLDEASSRLETVRAMRHDLVPMFASHALLGLAAVALARDDHETAAEAGEEALAFAEAFAGVAMISTADWFKRRLDATARAGGSGREEPPTLPDFMGFSLHTPTEQWVFIKLSQPGAEWTPQALEHLERGIAGAAAAGMERSVVHLSIARALVLQRAGHEEEASAAMSDVLRRAEPLGFIRSIVDYGGPARELVLRATMGRPSSPWVEALLAAFSDSSAPLGPSERSAAHVGSRWSSRPRVPAIDLTPRELTVLELLQQRLSNKEIGSRLFVEGETVRKHTLNIYRKLGVGGRRQAVAEAEGRGLLQAE